MKSLYVASVGTYAGKSLFSLILGLHLKEKGLKLGYFKPVGTLAIRKNGHLVDEDAFFIAHYLGIKEGPGILSPVLRTPELIEECLKEKNKDFVSPVRKAYEKIKKGKDFLIIGGAGALNSGSLLGLCGTEVAKSLRANVLLIGRYTDELIVEEFLQAKEMLGELLIGVIINRTPQEKIKYVQEVVAAYLKKKKIPVLGIIPEDIILSAVSVAELCEHLKGRFLCGEERKEELVEYFSIGAMNVESALRYFRRIPHKAVITGGDRPDIQLAALETSTCCIILTGNLYPNTLILARAEEAGIPLILVKEDTLSTIGKIEQILGHLRIREEKKVRRARILFGKNVDFSGLYKALGIRC